MEPTNVTNFDFQKIANSLNENYDVFSREVSLSNFLQPLFSDAPELFKSVISLYKTGILSFFQQGCNNDSNEIARILKKLPPKNNTAGAGYRFWSEIIPLLTPQSMVFAIACSQKWSRRQSRGNKVSFSSGCIVLSMLILILGLISLFFILKDPDKITLILGISTEQPINRKTHFNSETPVKAYSTSEDVTATQRNETQQVTLSSSLTSTTQAVSVTPSATLNPTITPTTVPTATDLPPYEWKFDHFVESIENNSFDKDRKYIIWQDIPVKDSYPSVESVLAKMKEISDPSNIPQWELQLRIIKDLHLPAYLEFPLGYNLEKITIRSDSGEKVTLSGGSSSGINQLSGSIENIGLQFLDRVENVLGQTSTTSTMISNWCNDQEYLYFHSENESNLLKSQINQTLTEDNKSKSPQNEDRASFQKSLMSKDIRIPFMLDNHDSILVTNGIELIIEKNVELKRNSIYSGISTKFSDQPNNAEKVHTSKVIVRGAVDFIFLGGFAYNADDHIPLDSSSVEVYGSVNKVFSSGTALDYHSSVFTTNPIIILHEESEFEASISEIQKGGISLAVDGYADAGELKTEPPELRDLVIYKESPSNFCTFN